MPNLWTSQRPDPTTGTPTDNSDTAFIDFLTAPGADVIHVWISAGTGGALGSRENLGNPHDGRKDVGGPSHTPDKVVATDIVAAYTGNVSFVEFRVLYHHFDATTNASKGLKLWALALPFDNSASDWRLIDTP